MNKNQVMEQKPHKNKKTVKKYSRFYFNSILPILENPRNLLNFFNGLRVYLRVVVLPHPQI